MAPILKSLPQHLSFLQGCHSPPSAFPILEYELAFYSSCSFNGYLEHTLRTQNDSLLTLEVYLLVCIRLDLLNPPQMKLCFSWTSEDTRNIVLIILMGSQVFAILYWPRSSLICIGRHLYVFVFFFAVNLLFLFAWRIGLHSYRCSCLVDFDIPCLHSEQGFLQLLFVEYLAVYRAS